MQEEYNKLKASYEALQRDYTKKCQQLKTYKTRENFEDKACPPSNSQLDLDNLSEAQIQQVARAEAVKSRVIQDYIKGLRSGNQPVLITTSGEIKAVENAVPKSIREAGEIARKVLNLKG